MYRIYCNKNEKFYLQNIWIYKVRSNFLLLFNFCSFECSLVAPPFKHICNHGMNLCSMHERASSKIFVSSVWKMPVSFSMGSSLVLLTAAIISSPVKYYSSVLGLRQPSFYLRNIPWKQHKQYRRTLHYWHQTHHALFVVNHLFLKQAIQPSTTIFCTLLLKILLKLHPMKKQPSIKLFPYSKNFKFW